ALSRCPLAPPRCPSPDASGSTAAWLTPSSRRGTARWGGSSGAISCSTTARTSTGGTCARRSNVDTCPATYEVARDFLWCQAPLATARDRQVHERGSPLVRRRPSSVADDQPGRGGGENGA